MVVEAMVALGFDLEGAGYVIKTGAKMKKRVEIQKAGVKVQRSNPLKNPKSHQELHQENPCSRNTLSTR